MGDCYDGSKSRVSRNVVFGKESNKNYSSHVNLTPGPGAYSVNDPSKARAPKVGFGLKLENRAQPNISEIPGPGSYAPSSNCFAKVGGLISKAPSGP